VKIGDVVKITFPYQKSTVGVFIRDDTVAIGRDKDGFPVVTRAFVLWGGEVYSTPLDQMEVISENR
jgi:hypothetical protein